MNTTDPMECVRRHICLMRWDLAERRKSRLDTAEKAEAKELEKDLVQRVSGVFDEEEVRAPNGYLDVIRQACAADGLELEPDDAERIWRAASGATHGKYWPTVDLQRAIPVAGAKPVQQRSVLAAHSAVVEAHYRRAGSSVGIAGLESHSGLAKKAVSSALVSAWVA